nr:MAG TPA: hypothetical protein [Caudoviricetes sp.]
MRFEQYSRSAGIRDYRRTRSKDRKRMEEIEKAGSIHVPG